MKQTVAKKALTLKTLTKNNVWDVHENDILRMLESMAKDPEAKDNQRRYVDIMRTAFTLEELTAAPAPMKEKYEKQGYKVGRVKNGDDNEVVWAVRKRAIVRVSDLTYENIHHITAAKLIDVLDRNFGGGWDSLSQSVKDIIESGFDISTTTVPKDRLHKPGGMYEKKLADGYEVLEVAKGSWVEAIFAKAKPEMEKPRLMLQQKGDDDLPDEDFADDARDEDEVDDEPMFNEDEINEENYRTTFEIEADPDEEADGMAEFEGED